jgi:hypothetical protein
MNFTNELLFLSSYIHQPIDDNSKLLDNKTRRSNWYFCISEYNDDLKNKILSVLDEIILENKIKYYLFGYNKNTNNIHGIIYTGNTGKNFNYINKLFNNLSKNIYILYMIKKINIKDLKEIPNYEYIEVGNFECDNKSIKLCDIINEIFLGKSINDLINKDKMTRYLIFQNKNIIEQSFYKYQEQQIKYPIFYAWFIGNSETGKTLMINTIQQYLNCVIYEIIYHNNYFKNFDIKLSSIYNESFFSMLNNLIYEKNKNLLLPYHPKIIIFTSSNDVPIDIRYKMHLILKFNFDADKLTYPGYDRVYQKINTIGIPLFLSYYKNHCNKFNIPEDNIPKNIEAKEYPTKKDNNVKITDSIVVV